MSWQWGSFDRAMRDAVDAVVEGTIANTMREAAATQTGDVKDALDALISELTSRGIEVIEQAIGTKAGP